MDYILRSFQAIGKAIGVLCQKYENLCLPLRNCFSYDLIAVEKNQLLRVKVFHTETTSPSGSYVVNIRKSGGYNKANTVKKPFDPKMCDLVFIDAPNKCYLIPSEEITQKRSLSLSMFEKYIIPS